MALVIAILIGLPAQGATEDEEPSTPSSSRAPDSLSAPPRLGGYPFASTEGFVFGGGSGDGSAIGGSIGGGYVGSAPFRLEAGVQDFAFVTAHGHTSSQGLFLAYAGLDSPLLGFGPSVGYFWGPRYRTPVFGGTLRIGASDGLHGQAQLGFGNEPLPTISPAEGPPAEEQTSTEVSNVDVRLQVPIARGGRALVAAFDFSPGPLVRLALGYRLCVSNAGRRDSTWIEIKGGLGVADTTFARTCSDCQRFVFGPLLNVGIEKRF